MGAWLEFSMDSFAGKSVVAIIAAILALAALVTVFSDASSSSPKTPMAQTQLFDAAPATRLVEVLPDVVNGWNTSVGTVQERDAAAAFFHTHVTDDPTVWTDGVMTPFIGKTLKMTGIVIEKRNAFNTVIEVAVKKGTVLWTIEEGPEPNVCGDWTEHINGGYTGKAKTAGFVSHHSWIEQDNKRMFGHKVANDWGLVDVTSRTDTTVVMEYWSYKKGKFQMTWTLDEHPIINPQIAPQEGDGWM